MPPSLESRIQAFVVDQTGCNPNQVHLHSRIAEDLGVDGDDAVELFEAFAHEFNVNLESLYANWAQHFGPEGGLPPSVLAVALGCLFAGLLVSDLSRGRVPVWLTTALLMAVCWWVAGLFAEQRDPTSPITMQDLVDAAAARQWVKQYKGSGTGELFRTLP